MDLHKMQSRLRSRKPRPIGLKPLFSVMIALIKVEGEWHVIFEKRAGTLRNQPNQVSFPGGKIEAGETPAQAAKRETCEELGIGEGDIKILSEMDYLVTRDNVAIHCYVGYIEGKTLEELKPNPGEVAYLFTVPLSFFLTEEPKEYRIEFEITDSEDFPYELIPGGKNFKFGNVEDHIYFYTYEERIIWGFTAKMMYYFVQVLLGSR